MRELAAADRSPGVRPESYGEVTLTALSDGIVRRRGDSIGLGSDWPDLAARVSERTEPEALADAPTEQLQADGESVTGAVAGSKDAIGAR
jgi:hypothetical protein